MYSINGVQTCTFTKHLIAEMCKHIKIEIIYIMAERERENGEPIEKWLAKKNLFTSSTVVDSINKIQILDTIFWASCIQDTH